MRSAAGLSHLNRLEVLDLSENDIEDCGRYGKGVFPPNVTILDLSGNPVADADNHRSKAVCSLSRLKILDGLDVSESDGKNRATSMHIIVPLTEDDGEPAGEAVLKFDKASDLWTLADRFCNVNDIKDELSRRQLVVMMKKEARRVWGVSVKDGEVTMRKMIETLHLTESEAGTAAEGRDAATTTAADEAPSLEDFGALGDNRLRSVKECTMKAIDAVESFVAEIESGEKSPATGVAQQTLAAAKEEYKKDGGEEEKGVNTCGGRKAVLARIVSNSQSRKAKDADVSKEALAEAKQLLAKKIEEIKKEKLADRRKNRAARETAEANKLSAVRVTATKAPQETKEEIKDRDALDAEYDEYVYYDERIDQQSVTAVL